jgi:hypothetical protein
MRQKKEVDKDYPVSAEQELLEVEAKPKYATGGIVSRAAFVDFGSGRLVPLNTKATPMEEWEPGDNKVMYASTKPQVAGTTIDGSCLSSYDNYVTAKRTEDLAVENLISGLEELTKQKANQQAALNLGNAEYDERFWALNRRIEQLEELVKVLEKKVIDLQQAPFVQPYNPIPTPYPYPLYPYPNPWYDPYRPNITTTGSTDPNVVKYSTTTGGTSVDTGSYKDLDKYYAELLKEGTR